MKDIKISQISPILRTVLFVAVAVALFLAGCGKRNHLTGGNTASQDGAEVAKTAYSQLGTMYRWGGESPEEGFDCSGLIWWAYGEHGINVPRVTSGQRSAGENVNFSNKSPGDIVVFNSEGSSSGLHTGLYLGNNKFIHSPRSGSPIRIDDLDNTYWEPRLCAIRRIVD